MILYIVDSRSHRSLAGLFGVKFRGRKRISILSKHSGPSPSSSTNFLSLLHIYLFPSTHTCDREGNICCVLVLLLV